MVLAPFDWAFGKLGDYLLDHRPNGGQTVGEVDTLDNFDPRTLRGWTQGPSTGGHRVYIGDDENSWYIDLGADGTIDAHVVRDFMGDYWADAGQGYRNMGSDPNGDGQVAPL